MKKIIVHNQQEMDSISDGYDGRIIIEGKDIVVRGAKNVELHNVSTAKLFDSVIAKLFDGAGARLYGHALARVYNDAFVGLHDNSSAKLYDNSSAELSDSAGADVSAHALARLYDNATVGLYENAAAELHGNAAAELHDKTIAFLYDKSIARLCDESTAHLCDESTAYLQDESKVHVCHNAIVYLQHNAKAFLYGKTIGYLYGNATAELYDNARVYCHGNSRILDKSVSHSITLYGNSHIIYHPRDIEEYLDYYGVSHNKVTATLYKAVMKTDDGEYLSNYDRDFEYVIGEEKTEKCDDDVTITCSYGIHVAPIEWALEYGEGRKNFAILEVEVNLNDIILPKYTDGKIRTSKVRVIREVPLEECGVLGEIMARKRKCSRWSF